MPNLQIDNFPSADHIGDVVGIQFPGEEEVALFIPGSGDVLLCAAAQWQSLKEGHVDVTLVADLHSTLISLGAFLA